MTGSTLRCALLMGCAAATLIAQQDGTDLLARVTRRVMESVDRLPRYMCTQTVEREQYVPTTRRSETCDRIAAEEQGGLLERRLSLSDRLRLDVAATDDASGEMYSWVGENHFENSGLFRLITDGLIANGSFSTMVRAIFSGDEATVTDRNDFLSDTRLLHQFGFVVPLGKSRYYFGDRVTTQKVAYDGSFLVDRESGDLVRLVTHAAQLPAATGSCAVKQTLDYSRVHLNGSDFLLPSQTALEVTDADGSKLNNRVVYSNCHEFRGQSKISFDDPADTRKAAATQAPSPAIAPLPAGLPVRAALTQKIDTATAAAGDPVRARLIRPIRDKNRVLVPAGSALNGRIIRVRFVYQFRVPVLDLVIRWESIVRDGVAEPFAASPAVRERVAKFQKGNLTQRVELGPLSGASTLEQATGQFFFSDVKPGFVVPSGMESDWVTGAP